MRLLMAAALVPSLALAAVPTSDGTYTACYHAHDGRLRLIDASGESCRKQEKKVTWTKASSLSTVSAQHSATEVVAVALPVGDPNCPQGGTQLSVNGAATYVCNGVPGPQGIPGVQGPMGFTGFMGPPGPMGAMGPAGPMGPVGMTGPQGPMGPAGPQGMTGPAGQQGPMGIPGPMGPSGVDGLPGMQGPAGPAGATGATGPQGAAGPTGPQGPKGDTGSIGPQGPDGATGPAGQSVTLTQLAPGNLNCPNGGVAVNAESGTAYVCSAPQGTAPLVDAAAIQKINGWAGLASDTAWTLCYKATRDNAGFFGTAAFHSRCDGRARTFFVAKSTAGTIFGGYAGRPWGSPSCVYKNDPYAFLFSLTNSFKHFALNIRSSSSLYDCPAFGPTFGVGNDFTTNLRDQASSTLGYDYVCRVGSGSPLCSTDYVGMAAPVALVELEVYAAP